MINTRLSQRLEKLEARSVTAAKEVTFTIRFIEPGTKAVVSTLVISDGMNKWWHAPESAAEQPSAPECRR
jgi:hypothetical protein